MEVNKIVRRRLLSGSANGDVRPGFVVQKQMIASRGRYLANTFDTGKTRTPSAMELAKEASVIICLVSMLVVALGRQNPSALHRWSTGLAMALSYAAGRLVSLYRAHSQPGFGFLGNIICLVFYHIFRKPIQMYQDEADPNYFSHMEALRSSFEKMSNGLSLEDVGEVRDIEVKTRDGFGLPVRVVYPKKREEEKDGIPTPPLVFFCHGGAFCLRGGAEETARSVANRLGAVVAWPKYRLAPEHKFPIAHDDCSDALSAVLGMPDELGFDPSRVILLGESAGGHIAASLSAEMAGSSFASRESSSLATGVKGVVLLSPTVLPYSPTSSHVSLHDGPATGHGGITWMWNSYLRDPVTQMTDPRANLLVGLGGGNNNNNDDDDGNNTSFVGDGAATGLSVNPSKLLRRAVVITSQFDPLRDEGEMLAAAWHRLGVEVHAVRRLEAHCLRDPSTMKWLYEAMEAILNDRKVPDCPP